MKKTNIKKVALVSTLALISLPQVIVPSYIKTTKVAAVVASHSWNDIVSNLQIKENGNKINTNNVSGGSIISITGNWADNANLKQGDSVIYTYTNQLPPHLSQQISELKDSAGQVAGHVKFNPELSTIQLVFDTDYVNNQPHTHGTWAVSFQLEDEDKTKPPYNLNFPTLGNYNVVGTKSAQASGNSIPTDGSFNLIKLDEKNHNLHLSGALYQVFDQNQKLIQELTTNSEGKAQSQILPQGDYTVKEKTAPRGYTIDTSVHHVHVSAGVVGLNAISLNLADRATKVTLIKADRGNVAKHLSGAHFKIVDMNGHVIVSDVVTNENGEVIIEKLPIGKYQVIETIAPTNYTLDATPMNFEITALNGSVNITLLDNLKQNQQVKIKTQNKNNVKTNTFGLNNSVKLNTNASLTNNSKLVRGSSKSNNNNVVMFATLSILALGTNLATKRIKFKK